MAVKHFDVLTPLEFLEDIEHEAKSAKKRIWAQAMEVEPGDIANRLLNLVEEAGKKSLDARLNIDHYSLMVTDGLPNFPPVLISRDWRKRLQIRKDIFSRIENNGAKISYINKPTLLEKFVYTMGRNHMKIFIVDDIAWIGGVNFADGYFRSQDIMVKITDSVIVDPIAQVFMQVHENKLHHDEIFQTKHKATLFIDSGQTGKSVILDCAVRMVEKADHLVQIATAFIPDSVFLDALVNAENRGVRIELAVPPPGRTIGVYRIVNKMSQIQMRLRNTHFTIYYEQNPVHAKILLVDRAIALLGSHNFSSKGVIMRTAELALQSTDRNLIGNLSNFYTDLTRA